MSGSSVFSAATQGLSVLDPAVPWMLAALMTVSVLGLRRQWSPERKALSPQGAASRLPWPVAGALLLSAALLFACLAWGVLIESESGMAPNIRRWDAVALLWAQNWSSESLRAFVKAWTHLGSLRVLMPLVLLVALWLLYRREQFVAAAWVVGCTANSLMLRALKNVFERGRPPHEASLGVSGFSFPSGHAAGILMVIGLLVWLLHDRVPSKWRAPVMMTGLLLVVSITTSRVFLQVHFLSDVLAGLLLGFFSLILTIAVMEYTRENAP